MLEPRTVESDSSVLPTPTRSDYKGANLKTDHEGTPPSSEHSLATTVVLLPTPVVNDMGDGKSLAIEALSFQHPELKTERNGTPTSGPDR
jgi:hypothetical protein